MVGVTGLIGPIHTIFALRSLGDRACFTRAPNPLAGNCLKPQLDKRKHCSKPALENHSTNGGQNAKAFQACGLQFAPTTIILTSWAQRNNAQPPME